MSAVHVTLEKRWSAQLHAPPSWGSSVEWGCAPRLPSWAEGNRRCGPLNSCSFSRIWHRRALHSLRVSIHLYFLPQWVFSTEAVLLLNPLAFTELPAQRPSLYQAHQAYDTRVFCLRSLWLPFSALMTPFFPSCLFIPFLSLLSPKI